MHVNLSNQLRDVEVVAWEHAHVAWHGIAWPLMYCSFIHHGDEDCLCLQEQERLLLQMIENAKAAAQQGSS